MRRNELKNEETEKTIKKLKEKQPLLHATNREKKVR